MHIRFTFKQILPSLAIYLSLAAGTIFIDYVLHWFNIVWVGRYLGIFGTISIISSFFYSLKKRKMITWGQSKMMLQSHEILGWAGALMVMVHGGIHFNALIPWLAMFSMLIVVASGLTGKFLLKGAKEQLSELEQRLRSLGTPDTDIERELLTHSLVVDTMKQWRKVHMPLSMIFFGLASLHIIITLLFWRWQ
ncbi:MAG: hypothetical protein ACOYNS_15925 [Bacteroidota bacterium]